MITDDDLQMYTTIKTQPAAEPIDLTVTKTMLRVDFSADDTLIAALISAARVHAEEICKITGITTVYQTWLSRWPRDGIIELPRRPVTAVASIKYYDEDNTASTIDSGNYTVITQAARPCIILSDDFSWPTDLRERDAIVIEYTAGQGASYTSVDPRYRAHLMGLVSVWYETRDGMTMEQQLRLDRIEWALRQDGY